MTMCHMRKKWKNWFIYQKMGKNMELKLLINIVRTHGIDTPEIYLEII